MRGKVGFWSHYSNITLHYRSAVLLIIEQTTVHYCCIQGIYRRTLASSMWFLFFCLVMYLYLHVGCF